MKPTVMILGCYHMANPGADAVNFEADDVLAPKRQREIQHLVEKLARFTPTKIALEVDTCHDAELEAEYQGYLNGSRQLERSEGYQLGFRLAKEMKHPKLYCVDWFRNPEPPTGEEEKVDAEAFANANNQNGLVEKANAMTQAIIQEPFKTITEIQKRGSVIDLFRFINQPETVRAIHRVNTVPALTFAQIGVADHYVGLEWLLKWYERNLKIFVNLTRITESVDDRILLLIGAGHVGILQQFLEDSEAYVVEDPLRYLEAEETQ